MMQFTDEFQIDSQTRCRIAGLCRSHLFVPHYMLAGPALLVVLVSFLIERFLAELVLMCLDLSLVEIRLHLHSQFRDVLLEFLLLPHNFLLLSRLNLVHQLLLAAPHLERSPFNLDLQIELHVVARELLIRIPLRDVAQRRLTAVQIAVLEQVVGLGVGSGDQGVLVLRISKTRAERMAQNGNAKISLN